MTEQPDSRLRLGLAGNPVSHSRSPVMHRAALDACGLIGSYELIECDAEGFRGLVGELRAGSWTGLNVTMPHKRLAHDLSDRLTDSASRSHSVNTLKIEDDAVTGHSTDVVAFRDILAGMTTPPGPDAIVVLGSGGSARAAIAAIDGPVGVLARNPEKVEALRVEFGQRVSSADTVRGSLVINCTPIGMHGEQLPDVMLDDAIGLIDLPYGAEATPAVEQALSRGVPVVDGHTFLATQAAASFTWWTGAPVAVGTMVEAVTNN